MIALVDTEIREAIARGDVVGARRLVERMRREHHTAGGPSPFFCEIATWSAELRAWGLRTDSRRHADAGARGGRSR